MKRTVLAVAAALPLAMSANAQADDMTNKTRDIVRLAMTELMVEKKLDAIDTWFAEPYIQHNQSVPSGLDGLRALAETAIAANPAFKYEMIRVFADGDVGVTHGIYEGFGETPLVAFDVFRVKDGRIVEHWDNLSPVTARNPSGRSQTDGPTEVADHDKTEANKALVSAFVNEVLVGGAFDTLPTYIDGDNYIQHNSNIADGLSGLGAGLEAMADAGMTMRYGKAHHVFGEGNFVLVLADGTLGDQPTAFYDLFRVEAGKIVEHWDVIAPILPDDQAANTNGRF